MKRKWERIVSRGKERQDRYSGIAGEAGLGLEGIKEGVQELGRLFTGAYTQQPDQIQQQPTPQPEEKRKSKSKPTRTPTSSTSTTSSKMSASTAATSVDLDCSDQPVTESSAGRSSVDGGSGLMRRRSNKHRPPPVELMVRDTGASPLVSPNPNFQRRNLDEEEERGDDDSPTRDSSDAVKKEKSSKRSSITDSAMVSSWVSSVMGKKWEEQ